MEQVKLVVFDMAGTTVKDDHTVEQCFYQAALESNLSVTKERIKAMQGLPKLEVIQTLWGEVIPQTDPSFPNKVSQTFDLFRNILEQYYTEHQIEPSEGTLETFAWLRQNQLGRSVSRANLRSI